MYIEREESHVWSFGRLFVNQESKQCSFHANYCINLSVNYLCLFGEDSPL